MIEELLSLFVCSHKCILAIPTTGELQQIHVLTGHEDRQSINVYTKMSTLEAVSDTQ